MTDRSAIRLNTRISGPSGVPVLLMMHSVACDFTLWDQQAKRLAGDFRIVRYDARGHGGSDAPRGDYTLDELGRDALAVLDAAEVGQAYLCGLSLGALTATFLALNEPARVRGMVIANTGIRIGTAEAWQARADMVLKQGMISMADVAIPRFFSDAFRAANPTTTNRFRAILLKTSPQGYAGCCAVLRDTDFTGRLQEIAVPTIVVGGTLDVPTPLSGARQLADGIPGAKLVALEAGHLSNVEQADGFTAAIRQILTPL